MVKKETSFFFFNTAIVNGQRNEIGRMSDTNRRGSPCEDGYYGQDSRPLT